MRLARLFPAAGILALPLVPVAAIAQIELVEDFNSQTVGSEGSVPTFAASDGQRSYFYALGADELSDLWVSDGTQAGTNLVAPGVAVTSELLQEEVGVGVFLPSGRAVLPAPTSPVTFGPQPRLLGTDGTLGGTEFLDAGGTIDLGLIGAPVVFGGEAWFLGEDRAISDYPGLWRTDGTSTGTQEVVAAPGLGGLLAMPLVAGGGGLHVVRRDPDPTAGTPQEILRFDGTGAAPTVLFTGAADQTIDLVGWAPPSNRLLVVLRTPLGAGGGVVQEMWSIGTSVAEKLAGAITPAWSVVNGSQVFFPGVDGAGVGRVFVGDGTAAGTTAVPGSLQPVGGPSPGAVAIADGVVHLSFDPATGVEPAFTNAAGSTLLLDTKPGAASAYVSAFVEYGGEAYFCTKLFQTNQGDLFRTDGTPAGTVVVPGSIEIGSASIFPAGRTQNGILYRFDFPGLGVEVWRANPVGVSLLYDIQPNVTGSSFPAGLVRLGADLLFGAASSAGGNQLFRLAPGAAPEPIVTLESAILIGGVQEGIALGDRALFRVMDESFDFELLVTDGTSAGSEIVDLAPGATSSFPDGFVTAGNRVYFTARTGSGGALALWVSDGTVAGTQSVADVALLLSPFGGALVDAQGIGGADVFFSAIGATGGTELWRSDGTAAGTVPVADIAPGAASSNPGGGAVVDGRFFFHADDGVNGREVWVTDGTAVGTQLFADLAPGAPSGVAGFLGASFDGRFVVDTSAATAAAGPVAIDPVTGQVQNLVDPLLSAANPGLAGAVVGDFRRFGDALAFATDGPTPTTGPAKLWLATDASSVAQPLPIDVEEYFPGSFVDVGGGVALVGGVDADGTEPWVVGIDGSASKFADFFPGPESSSPERGLRVGSRVYFAATDPVFGRELFSVSVANLGANVAEPFGHGCAQSAVPPTLAGVGQPTLGADFDVRLEGAAASAPVVWAVDGGFAPLSVTGPCQPLLPNPVPLALGSTDAGGVALLDLAVPAEPSILDLTLYFQALVVEVPGPFLGIASLSDGLEVVVGP